MLNVWTCEWEISVRIESRIESGGSRLHVQCRLSCGSCVFNNVYAYYPTACYVVCSVFFVCTVCYTPPGRLLLSVHGCARTCLWRWTIDAVAVVFVRALLQYYYTRAHRRWWRVSTVTQQVKAWRQNCHYRDYIRFHIWLKNHER